MDDENYTDVHRAFLRACARLSVLGPNQALNILASVQAKRTYLLVFYIEDFFFF